MSVIDIDLAVRRAMDALCAIVLGGGQGKRLYPLTGLRAKPAVPLLGRYRIIDIPLSNCIHSGIKRIFVLTQFNSASLNRHVTDSYKFDNFSKGFVEIRAAELTEESGDWFQGTADAVRQNLRRLGNRRASHWLILSGDQLYSMDFRELMATHLRTEADITIATLPVDRRDAQGFGILKVADDGRIVEFVEKPSKDDVLDGLVTAEATFTRFGLEPGDRPYLASMGIYVFRAEVVEALLEDNAQWHDFGKHVIPNSLGTHRVFSHIFDGYWEDIGTVRSYYETHLQMVRPDPPFQFYDANRIIYTHPRYLPGARVQDATVHNAIICEGSRITKAEITDSVIGIRSIIRPNTRISRTVLLGADFLPNDEDATAGPLEGIGADCDIDRAIIDKNACIGDHVVIRGSDTLEDRDGDGWAIRDGIVVVMKNATIPAGTRIE